MFVFPKTRSIQLTLPTSGAFQQYTNKLCLMKIKDFISNTPHTYINEESNHDQQGCEVDGNLSLKEEWFEVVRGVTDDGEQDGGDVCRHYNRKKTTTKQNINLERSYQPRAGVVKLLSHIVCM